MRLYSAVVTFSAVVSVPGCALISLAPALDELLADRERLRPLRVVGSTPQLRVLAQAFRDRGLLARKHADGVIEEISGAVRGRGSHAHRGAVKRARCLPPASGSLLSSMICAALHDEGDRLGVVDVCRRDLRRAARGRRACRPARSRAGRPCPETPRCCTSQSVITSSGAMPAAMSSSSSRCVAGPLLWSVPHATTPPAAWILRMFSCAIGVISFIHAVHDARLVLGPRLGLQLAALFGRSDAAYSG